MISRYAIDFALLPCEIMDKLSIDGGKFRVNHIYLNINSIEYIIQENNK